MGPRGEEGKAGVSGSEDRDRAIPVGTRRGAARREATGGTNLRGAPRAARARGEHHGAPRERERRTRGGVEGDRAEPREGRKSASARREVARVEPLEAAGS